MTNQNDLDNVRTFTGLADPNYAICDLTKLVYTTTAGMARILDIPETTLRRHLDSARQKDRQASNPMTVTATAIKELFLSKNCDINSVSGKLKLATGLNTGRANFYSAKQLRLVATVLQPDLAEIMADAGSQVYLNGLAGVTQIKNQQPPRQTLPTKIELAEAYMKVAKLEQSTNDLPGLADLDNRRIDHVTKHQGLPGRITITEYLSANPLPGYLFHTFCKRVNYQARFQTNYRELTKVKGVNRHGKTKWELAFPTSFVPTMDSIHASLT